MKILFMSQPQVLHPLYDEFCAGAPEHYEIVLYRSELPARPQFDGVNVVVEVGGAVSTPELRDLGGEADLLLWQILGTGLDDVDVTGFLRRGIRLANTPGQFSAVALAEHALFLMLLFAKRFQASQISIEEQLFCVPFTEELAGRTLGLIGFGASARELAKRAVPFGMRVLAFDVVPSRQTCSPSSVWNARPRRRSSIGSTARRITSRSMCRSRRRRARWSTPEPLA